MNPLFLSILVAEIGPGANHEAFLRRLPGILRVRVVTENNAAVIWPWLDLVGERRVSIDVAASKLHTLPEAFGTDQRIRQVRIAVGLQEIQQLDDLVRYVRGEGTRPPIVFLVNAELLAQRPDNWSAVFGWANVFVNPVSYGEGHQKPGSTQMVEDASFTVRFADWRAYLGDRMFVSLPALGAHANDEAAAPCPTKMGLHIVLDVKRNCVRVCDCVSYPSIPIDDNGLWLEAWRNEVAAAQSAAAEKCKGCSLWTTCQGGCLAPRPDGVLRDRFCPWPLENFLTKGEL